MGLRKRLSQLSTKSLSKRLSAQSLMVVPPTPTFVSAEEQQTPSLPPERTVSSPFAQEIWTAAYEQLRSDKSTTSLVDDFEKAVHAALDSLDAEDTSAQQLNGDMRSETTRDRDVELDSTVPSEINNSETFLDDQYEQESREHDEDVAERVAGLDGGSRLAFIDALLTKSSEPVEKSSYERKLLSIVIASFKKVKKGICNGLTGYPPARLGFTAACLIVVPVIVHNVEQGEAIQRDSGATYVISKLPCFCELVNLLTSEPWDSPQFAELRASIYYKIFELYKLVLKFLLARMRLYDSPTPDSDEKLYKPTDWESMVNDIKVAEQQLQEYIPTANNSQFKFALELAEKQSDYLKNAISGFSPKQLELAQRVVNKKHKKETTTTRRRAELTEKFIVDPLQLNTDTYDDYVRKISSPLAGTCQGPLRHTAFTEWANSDSGLFVLAARPGAGKSVLAKHFLNEVPSLHPTTVCSFFFRDEIEPNVAMCKITNELMRKCTRIENVEKKAEKSDRYSIWPELDLFWDLVDIASRDCPHESITIILDALNECGPVKRDVFLRRINDYRVRFPDSKVKFLLTTRPDLAILRHLPNATTLSLDEDPDCRQSVIDDITTAAQDRWSRFARDRGIRDEETKLTLIRNLEQQNDRTFLSTKLLFDLADTVSVRPSTDNFSRLIQHLPTSIPTAYRAFFHRIDEGIQEDVRVMLEIVLAASRPLTVREMSIAAMLRLEDCTSCEQEAQLGPTKEDFRKWLSENCGFLFEVYNDRVFLAHQTLKDYLFGDEYKEERPYWLNDLTIKSCHKTLGKSCIAYHSLPFVKDIQYTSIDNYVQTTFYAQREYHRWFRTTFDFGEYAFANWIVHIEDGFDADDYLAKKKEQDQKKEAVQEDEDDDGTDTETENEEPSKPQVNGKKTNGIDVKGKGKEEEFHALRDINILYPSFDLETALSIFCCSALPCHTEAKVLADLLPKDFAYRDDALAALSQSLMARYSETGNGWDLKCAVTLAQIAIDKTPCGHPQLFKRLATFDQGLNMRFWDLMDRDFPITDYDLRDADEAVLHTPPDHPDHALALDRRAALLERRYQCTKQFQHITQAIEDFSDILNAIPDSHPDRLKYLNHLANLLGQRSLDGGDVADADAAIEFSQRAVALTVENNEDEATQAMNFGTLAAWLGVRYQETKEEDDINDAIKIVKKAVEFTTPKDPSHAVYLCNLARRLHERFEATGSEEDFDEATNMARKAAELTPWDHPLYPFHRLFARVLREGAPPKQEQEKEKEQQEKPVEESIAEKESRYSKETQSKYSRESTGQPHSQAEEEESEESQYEDSKESTE